MSAIVQSLQAPIILDHEEAEIVGDILASRKEASTSQSDKGKDPVMETFLNNAFKKLSKVIPRGDIEAFMKFAPSAIYKRLMINLA